MKFSSLFATIALLASSALTMVGCADIDATGSTSYEVTDKILGGSNAQAPDWMVSILRNGSIHCGGTLIHKRWVLTAAHCVDTFDKSEYTICVGKNKISQCTEQNSSGVQRIRRHRRFNRSALTGGYDIAVLELKKSFNNRNLSPLARQRDEPNGNPKVRARGWGVSSYEGGIETPNRLQEVELRYLSTEECAQFYPGLSDTIICTQPKGQAGQVADKSICNGDSGGPIHFNGLQLGVTSFVNINEFRQCSPGRPNAYTRVSAFGNWIKNKTNGDVVIN